MKKEKKTIKVQKEIKLRILIFGMNVNNLGGIKEYANKLYLKIQRCFISKKKDSITPQINFKNLNLIIGSDFKTQPKTEKNIIRSKKNIQKEILKNTFNSSDSSESTNADQLTINRLSFGLKSQPLIK